MCKLSALLRGGKSEAAKTLEYARMSVVKDIVSSNSRSIGWVSDHKV